VKPETCDTCGQAWHEKTDHEANHTYTAKELLALGTEVNQFDLNGSCCGVKSEVTLTDLKATVRFCPICGYDGKPGADFALSFVEDPAL
jgi:hypothetical protein